MIDDDDSLLRKAERDLYTTDIQPPKRRSLLHQEKVASRESWDDHTGIPVISGVPMSRPIQAQSIFKRIFLASLGLLACAAIILGISFLHGGNAISEKNVAIAITTKTFVDGGESLPVQVSIANKNRVAIELATLVLEYPQGGGEDSGAVSRITRELPVISAGATHQESFTIQLYGTENSQRTITAHIQFRAAGLNAVYEKDQPIQVTIRTSPVTITLKAPDKAIPNQEIPLVFTVVGNGTAVLSNTALVMQYPDGFVFSKAEPSPSFGNSVWYLGDLPPGASRTITVHGSISGAIADLKTIRASVGSQSAANEQVLDTTYNSLAQVIPLAEAFLDAHIVVGDQTGTLIPVSGSQPVRVSVQWKNTLPSTITNAQLAVSLSGSAYDPSSVQPSGGFFDEVSNRIVWTSQEQPALAAIGPGQVGQVSFSVTPRQFASGTAVTNPMIALSLDVLGYQSGGTKLSATGIDAKKLAVNSDLNLLTKTTHYTGVIQNTGPMPMVPGKETTYALEWKIANTRNRVSGASVATTLPTGVSWKGVIVPETETTALTYNEVTRQLVWNIGDVPAGSGQKIVTFKVGITPSPQQGGIIPPLTGQVVLTGKDGFTGQDLTVTKLPLTTQLLNDGNGPGRDGYVGKR